MRNDDDWSELKTVSSFDNGYNNNTTRAVGVSGCQEVEHFSPSSILVESLIEQLCKMLEKDPADQKTLYLMICDKLHQMNLIDTSYHMDEFEFMRSHYQRALYNLLSVAKSNHRLAKVNRGESGDGNNPTASGAVFPRLKLELELTLPPGQGSVIEWSRYANEFVELEFIARGGFGLVYKARHKLDDTVYAVKKIHLRYQNANGFLRSLKEVKMLACLNHPNIVAYKAAWLEPFDYWKTGHSGITTTMVDNSKSQGETEESSDNIVFEKSKSSDCRDKEQNRSNSLKDDAMMNSSDSSSNGASNMAVCKYRDLNRIRTLNFMSSLKQDWATLYVQMELCEENMREWLDRRNRSSSVDEDINMETPYVDIEQCLSVFIKVLKGIEYIHDKGIVHHDIKPSNIFMSKDLRQIQVGDFGLACCLITHTTVPLVHHSSKHEGRIGTKLYAAPEQVKGVCSAKSDIYSIGIILLELIQPFRTEMERSKVISQLKHGQILTELSAKWPKLVKIIRETVCASVNKRPTATELLNMVYNCKDKTSSTPESICSCDKEKLVLQLKSEIAAKDEEILRLKQRLGEIN